MDLPYSNAVNIENTARAGVFRVDYDGGIPAVLKLFFKHPLEKDYGRQRCEREYKNLERVSGIKGIPAPIALLDELKGTAEDLRVKIQKRELLAFEGGLVMELIDPLIFIDRIREQRYNNDELFFRPTPPQDRRTYDKSFFDALEEMARQIHERGSSFPVNTALYESDGCPVVPHWDDVTSSGDEGFDEALKKDFAKIAYFRDFYQARPTS